jgi:hypothetical protein
MILYKILLLGAKLREIGRKRIVFEADLNNEELLTKSIS